MFTLRGRFLIAVLAAVALTAPLDRRALGMQGSETVIACFGRDVPPLQYAKETLREQGINLIAFFVDDEELRGVVHVFMYEEFLILPLIVTGDGSWEAKLVEKILTQRANREQYADSSMVPVNRKAAYRTSAGRVVLHYGEHIARINDVVRKLRLRGVEAVALPGSTEGHVEVFTRGRIGPKDCCNQQQIDNDTLVEIAATEYFTIGISHKRRLAGYYSIYSRGLERQMEACRELAEIDARLMQNEREILRTWDADPDTYLHILQLNGNQLPRSLEERLHRYEVRTGRRVDRHDRGAVVALLRSIGAGSEPPDLPEPFCASLDSSAN